MCIQLINAVSCHGSQRHSKYTHSTATIILGKWWQCSCIAVVVLLHVHVSYSSVETLQRLSSDKSIAGFLKLCQAKLNHLLLLGAYLLKPVQRVLKYSPLLRVSSHCVLSLACMPSVSHLGWGWVVFRHLVMGKLSRLGAVCQQHKWISLHYIFALVSLLCEQNIAKHVGPGDAAYNDLQVRSYLPAGVYLLRYMMHTLFFCHTCIYST